jgi:hypothetical protein
MVKIIVPPALGPREPTVSSRLRLVVVAGVKDHPWLWPSSIKHKAPQPTVIPGPGMKVLPGPKSLKTTTGAAKASPLTRT